MYSQDVDALGARARRVHVAEVLGARASVVSLRSISGYGSSRESAPAVFRAHGVLVAAGVVAGGERICLVRRDEQLRGADLNKLVWVPNGIP